MRNRFIVLEGIDGSGTTTQLHALAERLRSEGRTVITTGEPTPGPIGRLLRQILSGSIEGGPEAAAGFDWTTLALLFAADRAAHAQHVIRPALLQGCTVLCDRYDLSSRIYQSVTAPDPETALPWVCAINSQAPRPDLTLVLDVAPETAELRRAERAETVELFEQNQLQRTLAHAYQQAERYVPNDRLKHVPGNLPIGEVTEILYAACTNSSEAADGSG